MSDPDKHIKALDAELHQMGADGHLNEFKANVAADNVEHAIAQLKKEIDDEESID